MNLFLAVRPRSKTRSIDRDYLPEVNSFVDVAAGGTTENLPVEAVGRKDFVVRRPANAMAGESALFNYSNRVGRFRFYASCVSLDATMATYDIPEQLTVIEKFGSKRRYVRLKTTLPVRWRCVRDGNGYGNFIDGHAADLSCAGMALAVPGKFDAGTQLEISFDFAGGGEPFALIGTLTRATQKTAGGLSMAGMAFASIRPTEENRIAEFIAHRRKTFRKRALPD